MNGNLPRGCADIRMKDEREPALRASGHSPAGDFGFLISSFILHPSSFILRLNAYSHSMVAGGFEVTSYSTRLTCLTSLQMRLAMR